jgi:hypothetical protein
VASQQPRPPADVQQQGEEAVGADHQGHLRQPGAEPAGGLVQGGEGGVLPVHEGGAGALQAEGEGQVATGGIGHGVGEDQR